MASPAELMKTISAATGVPLATVTDIDRRLVKGGLRTKGGRGFNVAHATPLDAARLLTAILASPLATNAVDAVEHYAGAIVDPERSAPTLFTNTGIDELAALPAHHSFIEALAALIASATSGSLATMLVEKESPSPKIELFAFTRATYGRIRLSQLPGDQTTNVEYSSSSTADATGDLEQSRRITERTAFAIAQLLREEHGT